MNDAHKTVNRLNDSTSPYLLQHADNPVDWWPWCQQALDAAKQENKLVLLSIGYSACHWCHVMAHESFEDQATADIMNTYFINIKVDREQRPDLDKIYQTAHQMLNQRPGGWPLTMILTPEDQIPFFAGTYFPVDEKHGMPPFKDVLLRINEFYHDNPAQIDEQNASLISALDSLINTTSHTDELNSAPLDQARRQLEQQFDNEHAGFGKAPKFPHPTNLVRLLRHWNATQLTGNEDNRAKDMLFISLQAMAAGGLYDQLRGGFFRYSVDDLWMIPHFEKMLYDNGPLLGLYAQAAKIFNDLSFERICTETANWIIEEMQSTEGGYFSTLDADSEGKEGKFYVWTPEQVKSILNEQEFPLFAAVYGLDRKANFEGHWHLHMFNSIEALAQKKDISVNDALTNINRAKQKLLTVRNTRIHPGRDEKILVAWNALMIKGMAQAGRLLQKPDFIFSAQRACDFIFKIMFSKGRLYANYKDGSADIMAYLDDYAFMLDALLELLSAQWQSKYLSFAIELAESLLEHFEDKEAGGFYFTAHDHEKLIQRPKPISDEAIPSGNAVATYALARLGHLLSEPRYIAASEHTIANAWNSLGQAPYAHAAMLDALEEHLYPPSIIIIRGNEEQKQMWEDSINATFNARTMYFYIDRNEEGLNTAIAKKAPAADKDIAYLCSGKQCLPPCETIDELAEQLSR
ncbi:Uncharacterized protein YyaL [hydrothermal vent metagenome]|uniref:Uncharacterized protein YyaL n=1 Tax=hydrothermal vent metagenome TaxID=652676 RepID=A0A3B0ZYA1_9ZZZZ